MRIKWEKSISTGLMALIVFTALAHGAVEPWSELIFVVWVSVLCLFWALKIVRDNRLLIYVPANAWPLAAFVLLAVVQGMSFQDRTGQRHSLSFDVEATRGTALMLGCLLLASLMAANFLAHRERLQKLAQFLTIFGLALATFALIQHFTWNERFYWMRAAQTEVPFGPFVNRNHFAGYMELLLPWPVAIALARRNSAERFFYIFVAAWMAVAAVFSLSRGGMISIFAELMFLAAFSPRRPPYIDAQGVTVGAGSKVANFLRRASAVTAIILATLGGLVWLGAERVVNRLSDGQSGEQAAIQTQNFAASRSELWRDSLAVFHANPLTGAGLGAFETVLPGYSQGQNLGLVTSQTHNDYLQILTDTGIVGALLLVWFLLATGRAVWAGLRLREPLMHYFVLACGAGIFGLLVHSLFDFNLQLPSHALLFLAFSAIAAQLSELARVIAAARVIRPFAVP